jgi:endonuclease G
MEGEWLTIIQHPNGEPKQVCVRENRLIKRTNDVLWYSTDTLGGSSGSPVFNNDWFVVALHHSGVPEMQGGKIRDVDGNFHDPRDIPEERVKWIANEGIRASRIAQALKQQLPNHPLLQPMFRATPQSARVASAAPLPARPGIPSSPVHPEDLAMSSNQQSFSSPVTLRIDCGDGRINIQCDSDYPDGDSGGRETTGALEAGSRRRTRPAPDFVFDANYAARPGFQPGFLGGGYTVGLPTLSANLLAKATPLKPAFGGGHILHYCNSSVVMHSERRFAIYSAANVSAGGRYDMGRPPDVWRVDPRIAINKQVTNTYYASNEFDRGHLTRREDLEFGPTPLDALQSAADTCHWTNCTPQHAQFNQNKEIWQGIERHILEGTIQDNQINVQVFTGPIFTEDDPEYRDIQYPVSYWKVVAALTSAGKLSATAYIASQADVIEEFGIEAARVDLFGPFKNFQVRISEVERLTDLTFTFAQGGGAPASLTTVDPVVGRRRRRSHRPGGAEEARVISSGYLELRSLDDIVMA